MDIIKFVRDKNLINDQSLSMPQEVLLKSIYGSPLTDKELDVFKTYTGRSTYQAQEQQEVDAICGRRSGKDDKIATNIAIYEAAIRKHEKHLSKGERGHVVLIAQSKKACQVTFGYIRGKLEASPLLSTLIQDIRKEEIDLNNDITISIWPCSYRAPRGISIICAICSELAFYRVEGINVDKEVIDSIRPAMATFPYAKLIKITTPYSKKGEPWNDTQRYHGKDDAPVLVWNAPSIVMNPTISKDFLAKEEERDPEMYRREYLAEFSDSIVDFLGVEDIQACVVSGRTELPYSSQFRYYAFCDPSGGRADSFTLTIAHREDKTIGIDVIRERIPPFNPDEVVSEFAKTLKEYKISRITGDRYSGEWVVKAFRDHGITYMTSKKVKGEIYIEFLPLINTRRVELLDNKRLIAQLRGLERKTGRGRDIIDHAPGAKDDVANCVAGVSILPKAISNRKLEVIWLGVEPNTWCTIYQE